MCRLTGSRTGLVAGLTVLADKDARDHCVVAVRGTFSIGPNGEPKLAEEQEPLVFADSHHGDPETTSIKYECDFAPYKPFTDVLVNATAFARGGHPVDHVVVGLEMPGIRKQLLVVGDRVWLMGVVSMAFTAPAPFVTMPITFDRAFGGRDEIHADPRKHGAELRDPSGRGYWRSASTGAMEGTPLPNIEDPREPLRGLGHSPSPAGFACVGRGWRPKIQHAGTYDQRRKEEKFPYLPDDFEPKAAGVC